MGFHRISRAINSHDTISLENAKNYIHCYYARQNFFSGSQLDQSEFKGPGLEKDSYYLSRPQETTASGRGGMCSRMTGMSPHMGVRQGTTGFARGAPWEKGYLCNLPLSKNICYFIRDSL